MPKQVNLYEAKTQLSKLVDEAAKGGEILIAKNGKPLAALVPAERVLPRPKRFGQWTGAVTIAADFDEVDEEIAALMNEGPLFPGQEGPR